ncbi:TetR family transcriptional regulator [Rhodobacter veldkampii DSM 11550]|uniref:TetR family transcriptional regulator n=1 Tax=Phaeovulum veldkampii DSM 11550 TaxID=1185920 RepID=A0A2T4JM42_9RHOB|nr:TetR/AcrR family transcriptional regulator [Phaeovulum veldkampii]MBK5947813.1 TetR family transcriptional regulator [Phaeovulum veldkampii DSM 11550]NCU20172.1 TetR/AcrR family transcriptional regulator [Candidatus Falkowbacteria bacterium]PTE18964.1 TetR family transcriptional regulator [Phaeovulum veldkampii DSM 11550]TDQ64701.1 TetR family transcriptional regulator [Phaeovulum veldkampii DSM 11550]
MPKQGYHHGNLRQALVEAALDLIETRGPQGFTLSEAAKSAGVTPAAVYRHFEGRDDLIAECARQGYAIFADLMEHAWAGGQPSALVAFGAVGRAYLAFARRFPGHYTAMFEAGLSPNRAPLLAQAAERAEAVMAQAAEALSRHIPEARRPPAAMFSAHVWALSHGVVELYGRAAPGTRAPFSPDDLLETGIGIYLRGLGLIAADT